MKKGYLVSMFYNNRWTNTDENGNGKYEHGVIFSSAKSAKEQLENIRINANARRPVKVVEFEY